MGQHHGLLRDVPGSLGYGVGDHEDPLHAISRPLHRAARRVQRGNQLFGITQEGDDSAPLASLCSEYGYSRMALLHISC